MTNNCTNYFRSWDRNDLSTMEVFLYLGGFFLISCIIGVANEKEIAPHKSLLPCGEELEDISTFPGEERYNQSLVIYNPAYGYLHPGFFAFPKSEIDVQRCLKCAYENHVDVVIRSGGHSILGYSTVGSEGFVIYLSEMNQVVIDDAAKVIHIQAGARWGDIYNTTGSRYLVVGGMCPTVGVSGYVLGGGYSILSRYHGLAIDSLISATMVTANGSSVVFANSTVHPDLFWALRGGGGGNFGVVTKFSIQLHPTHPNYVYGTLKFKGDGTHQFLEILSNIAPQLPKEVYFEFFIFPSQISVLNILFIGNYSNALKILNPFIEIALSVDLKNYSSYDQVLKATGKHIPATTSQLPEVQRGCVLKEMSKEVAKIVFGIEVPDSCRITFDQLGGAVNTYTSNETAYHHRNASFDYYVVCFYSNASELAKVDQFEDNLFNSLVQGEHCAGGYINDIDSKVQDWQHFYYSENYERLVEIKQDWNPIGSGTLHFLQEIGSKYQPKALGCYDTL